MRMTGKWDCISTDCILSQFMCHITRIDEYGSVRELTVRINHAEGICCHCLLANLECTRTARKTPSEGICCKHLLDALESAQTIRTTYPEGLCSHFYMSLAVLGLGFINYFESTTGTSIFF